MIKINNLCKSFKTVNGKKQVLNNISLEILDNQVVVIGGENGSGKSVLMNIISGLEEATSGKVEIQSKVGYVFQEAETQILGETVAEDVAFGAKNLGFSKKEVEERVEQALEFVGLSHKKDDIARFLSGGEKRRLAVACMLAMDLPVLILDEPYANLDFSGVKQVNALIRKLKMDGKTVIVLTHEIEKCLALADKFVVLYQGEIKFDGSPADGLKENLEQWNIKNPLNSYSKLEDLVWI